LKKEEERVASENREYAQEMQRKDIAHKKLLSTRQEKDVNDFERGRRRIMMNAANLSKSDLSTEEKSAIVAATTRIRTTEDEDVKASTALTGDRMFKSGPAGIIKAKVMFKKVGQIKSGGSSFDGSGRQDGSSRGTSRERSPRRGEHVVDVGGGPGPGVGEKEKPKKTVMASWGSDSDSD
tara:strand:+ start:1915 stop:2454 length:540 start_codon:yes stop_codon:yes gene_type:complete